MAEQQPLDADDRRRRLTGRRPAQNRRRLPGRKLLGGKTGVSQSGVRISIPADIRKICTSDPERAESIQTRVREQFEKHIAAGRAAVGFELNDQQGSYVLEPYED